MNKNNISSAQIVFDNEDLRTHIFDYIYSSNFAATNGLLSVFESKKNDASFPITSDTMIIASTNGHLNIVKYLHNNYYSKFCSSYAIDYAAYHGHLDIIKYLMENNNEINIYLYSLFALYWSALNGHLPVVKYMCENIYLKQRDKINFSNAIDYANSRSGHINIINYLSNLSKNK